MTPRAFGGAFLAIAVATVGAAARDPGPVDTRGRDNAPAGPPPRFIPERVDVTTLHGPTSPPQERRRLYERVEDDVDRGRGRVEDERAYEIRRLQDDRDARLRRIRPRRELERVEEEYDRRLRTDAQARRREDERQEDASPSQRDTTSGDTSPTIVRPTDDATPDPGGSALARFVAEQERLLAAARERYQADLRAAESERDDAAARAGGTPRARSLAERRFAERRAELTREYQQRRRGILGTP